MAKGATPQHFVSREGTPGLDLRGRKHSGPYRFGKKICWTAGGNCDLIRAMQTLDLSGTAPQSENRLKSLFWPTIHTATDVDYLGSQGYWICSIVAVGTFLMSFVAGHPIAGFFGLLYYYFGGMGVREKSIFAAIMVFIMFLADTILAPGILKFFGCVLLLSNTRATFIASFWDPGVAEAEAPMRFDDTWGDKFADKLPAWLWPKIKYGYYVFAVLFLALTLTGLLVIVFRGQAHRLIAL